MLVQRMRLLLIGFFITMVNCLPKQKIAVIGAGIAGTSTCKYLSDMLENVNITLFQEEGRIGGRTLNWDIQGKRMQMGGTFFIQRNLFFMELIQQLNLTYIPTFDSERVTMGTWDGKEIIYNTNTMFYIVKTLWKFGLAPMNIKTHVMELVQRFMKIYDITQFGQPGKQSNWQLLEWIQMQRMIEKSADDYLSEIGINEQFRKQFLNGIYSSIYNQNVNMNAFAGLVSLAGMFHPTYQIEGGNSRVSEKIVDILQHKSEREKSNPEGFHFGLIKHTQVNYIEKGDVLQYKLTYNKTTMEDFDAVFIAFPLVSRENPSDFIRIIDVKNPTPQPLKHFIYKQTVVNYVYGKIKMSFFGLPETDDSLPDVLLSVNSSTPISQIILVCQNCRRGALSLYQIQSHQFLKNEYLKSLFYTHEIERFQIWNSAYPLFKALKQEDLPPVEVQENIFYINSFEVIASCMETQLISAHNAINLFINRTKSDSSWSFQKDFSNFLKQQSKDGTKATDL